MISSETPSLPPEGRVGVEWEKFVKKTSVFIRVSLDTLRSIELTPFSPDPSFLRERRGNLPTGLRSLVRLRESVGPTKI